MPDVAPEPEPLPGSDVHRPAAADSAQADGGRGERGSVGGNSVDPHPSGDGGQAEGERGGPGSVGGGSAARGGPVGGGQADGGSVDRPAVHMPEWVAELRRLYVEPTTRAELRQSGAIPARKRSRTRAVGGGAGPRRRAGPGMGGVSSSEEGSDAGAGPRSGGGLSLGAGPSFGAGSRSDTPRDAVSRLDIGAAAGGAPDAASRLGTPAAVDGAPRATRGGDHAETSDSAHEGVPAVDVPMADPKAFDPARGPHDRPRSLAELAEATEPQPSIPTVPEPPVAPADRPDSEPSVDQAVAERDSGRGRPGGAPPVTVSWRGAESLDLGIPEATDSEHAIIVDPPSQLVAPSRRRRRSPDGEGDPGTGAEHDSGEPDAEPRPTAVPEAGDDLPSRAAVRAASSARSGNRRTFLAVSVALLALAAVLGYFLLLKDSAPAAAPADTARTVTVVAAQDHRVTG